MNYNKKVILFMPSIEDGGVEKNFFNIANFLTKKFKKVVIITTINKSKKRLDKNIIVRSFKINKNISRRAKYFLSIYLLIKELIKKKEKKVVLSFQANVYCIFVCKIFGYKVITRSNTSIFGWSKNFRLKLYKFFYSLADSVVVNSKALQKEFKEILQIQSNLIYNPLDKKRILKLSKKKTSINFFKKKSINLINVGRLVEQKDHLTLLKAIKILKSKIDVRLIIIGKGSLKNNLKNYIRINKLYKNVKILSFTDNPFKFYKKSNFFVLTSIFEGLPNVLMEAMLLKKFIISSNCPTGPKEILNSGKYGVLFKPNDYKKLADLIFYYSNNKKEYKLKIREGYKSLERFDYTKNLNKYLEIINKF